MNYTKTVLAGVASLALALVTVCLTNVPAFAASTGSAELYAQLSPDELDSLVAPIALYPDALLAQVLGAATYPDQVIAANQFVKVNSDLKGDALRAQVENRDWDPAVQALTQFASVLEQLARNISWTSALGDAAANQQADVMAAVQRMRVRAYSAGTLKSGAEVTVVQQNQVIVIEPAKANFIYVPSYNPTVVYGSPVVVPGYTSDVVAASLITFGVGVAVAAAVGGSCGFGMSWSMGWTTTSIYCGGSRYYGNPYWYGGYYPGFYPGYRPPYYYPPPRPPYYPARPPAAGNPPRPTQPIERPPGGPNAGARPGAPWNPPSAGGGVRPGGPSQLPATGSGTRPTTGQRPSTGGGARPAGPGQQPATGGGARPSGPSQMPSDRSVRGYGPAGQPARPNGFSGTGGGRPQSARGNASMAGGRGGAGGGRG